MNKQQLLYSLKQQGFSGQILNAFSKVKRENFIPESFVEHAYEDNALPIGEDQTISQPYTIAVMLSMLNLKRGQKVLEIGSGCGYVLALLSEIVGKQGKVFGVEVIKELAGKSINNTIEYQNINIYNQNGATGLKEKAPFDRILISAAISKIPKKILNQLRDNGILVAPIGCLEEQTLTSMHKVKDNFVIKEKIPGFVFVNFVDC